MKRRARPLIWAAAVGYLVGTAPSAAISARLAAGGSVDLRSSGSGNPGGLNALRLLGRRAGAAVIVADVGKGVAACVVGRRLAGDRGAHVAGVAAVTGHCFPLWTRFRGGKGVATSFGQSGRVSPPAACTVLVFADGETRPLAICEDYSEAVELMVEHILATGEPIRAAVGHAAAASRPAADDLAAELTSSASVSELERYRVGPAVGAHTGPLSFGAFWWPG